MKFFEALKLLPSDIVSVSNPHVLVVLSGGMDSTIAMRLAIEKYGAHNVHAISFDYGQKQIYELECAKKSTKLLGVNHKIVDASFLGDISQGFSANVDTSIPMPTIEDVLGDPTPRTYVPNRNMILMSIAAAYAETKRIPYIIMGLQVHDEYGYYDTTQRFVDKVNSVLSENRSIQIKVIAPFSKLSKTDEIKLLLEMDKNVDLLKHTLTCYNPKARWWTYTDNMQVFSCGKCPSCSERKKAFKNIDIGDPRPYLEE